MAQLVIIGAGHVGSSLAASSTRVGHHVTSVSSSSPIDDVARSIGAADFIVLAVPYQAALRLAPAWVDALQDKIVIDATNPLTADFSALTVGFDSSGAERIAAALGGARVVKALNAVLAPHHDPAAFVTGTVFVPVAGDDDAAVSSVIEYLASLGFDAVPAGPLVNARYIEPLAEVLVQMAYFNGAGTGISLALQRS